MLAIVKYYVRTPSLINKGLRLKIIWYVIDNPIIIVRTPSLINKGLRLIGEFVGMLAIALLGSNTFLD